MPSDPCPTIISTLSTLPWCPNPSYHSVCPHLILARVVNMINRIRPSTPDTQLGLNSSCTIQSLYDGPMKPVPRPPLVQYLRLSAISQFSPVFMTSTFVSPVLATQVPPIRIGWRTSTVCLVPSQVYHVRTSYHPRARSHDCTGAIH